MELFWSGFTAGAFVFFSTGLLAGVVIIAGCRYKREQRYTLLQDATDAAECYRLRRFENDGDACWCNLEEKLRNVRLFGNDARMKGEQLNESGF